MGGRGNASLDGSNDEVFTPPIILKSIVECLGPIGLDPCARPAAVVESKAYFTLSTKPKKPDTGTWYYEKDGLTMSWDRYGLTFVNPPYSQLQYPEKYPWVIKAREEADEAVLLLKASTSSRWWQDEVAHTAPAINMLRGRVKHLGEEHGAAFEQALVYFGPRPEVFLKYFGWSWGWPIRRF